jgi:hypothetical protein
MVCSRSKKLLRQPLVEDSANLYLLASPTITAEEDMAKFGEYVSKARNMDISEALRILERYREGPNPLAILQLLSLLFGGISTSRLGIRPLIMSGKMDLT